MVGWGNPELRGDEYMLDDDVTKFFADAKATDMRTEIDVMDDAGRPCRAPRSPNCAASGRT